MQTIVFGISQYEYLLKKIFEIEYGPFEKGEVETIDFSDGEVYHRILSQVSGKNVFLIGGTINDKCTLELFDIACALVQNNALSITIIIPFMGYSTMERAVKEGEVVKAKTRAMLLSSIPTAPMGNKIVFIDLHTEGLPHYFEGNVRTKHLYAKKIIMETVKEIAGKNKNLVLASTDAGRAKWVESLANDLNINAAFVFKRRISGSESHVTSINADVNGKDVIIYDDMIRTGGSIVNAAEAYKKAGANKIYVITTHGLFTNGGLDKIKSCGLVEFVMCTDTHPESAKINDPFLKVKSVAGLIFKQLFDGK